MEEVSKDNQQLTDTIKIRQEFIWHYVSLYLENLRISGIMADEGFKSRFEELYRYTADKLDTEFTGDILDFYMVIEKSRV